MREGRKKNKGTPPFANNQKAFAPDGNFPPPQVGGFSAVITARRQPKGASKQPGYEGGGHEGAEGGGGHTERVAELGRAAVVFVVVDLAEGLPKSLEQR